jgi:protein with PEP-CTERM/exosortase system signal
MKVIRLLVATGAVLMASAGVAHANLVLSGGTVAASFTDLGAQGFGAAPRMLTLQTNTSESGASVPVNQETGDAIDGDNKSSTPLLSSLGWTSGANVAVGFNADQSGNTGITLQTLTLNVYNASNALVGSFSTAAPITFTQADLALEQGNGNSVFKFVLDGAQSAAFTNLIAGGSTGWRAGINSTLGCPAGSPAGCLVSNDGPDTFVGFNNGGPTPPPVPDSGSTLSLLGAVLVGIGIVRRRMGRV